jgi:type II secretory pathway pseudopilin PulG
MYLRGQERAADASGYAMAALLVALNVMAILITVAMPVWKTAVKREREAELIWRGSQYARAIMLFSRKYANANPPNIDILLTERFLRKKYKDPMTKDGEFQLLYAAQQQQRAGAGGVTGPAGQITQPTAPAPQPTPLDQRSQGPAGATGGIMGVASKSTETGLRLFNGRSKYNEWAFTVQTVLGNRAGAPGAPGAPGSQRPGVNMPGGPPGTSKPGMPRVPGGGFGVPPPGQPTPPRVPRPPG